MYSSSRNFFSFLKGSSTSLLIFSRPKRSVISFFKKNEVFFKVLSIYNNILNTEYGLYFWRQYILKTQNPSIRTIFNYLLNGAFHGYFVVRHLQSYASPHHFYHLKAELFCSLFYILPSSMYLLNCLNLLWALIISLMFGRVIERLWKFMFFINFSNEDWGPSM